MTSWRDKKEIESKFEVSTLCGAIKFLLQPTRVKVANNFYEEWQRFNVYNELYSKHYPLVSQIGYDKSQTTQL